MHAIHNGRGNTMGCLMMFYKVSANLQHGLRVFHIDCETLIYARDHVIALSVRNKIQKRK